MNDFPRRTSAAKSKQRTRHPEFRPPAFDVLHAIASFVGRLALSRPLAVVDLETTGVCVERDRIVQIGIIRVEPNGDYCELDRLVRAAV